MVTHQGASTGVAWVLLSYRVPRTPSAPRIAVWRRLRRLGVAQLGDGLVALPEDARTREHLEWVAEEIDEAGGSATLWRAQTLSRADERAVAESMSAARAEEYRALTEQALAALTTPATERRRQVRKLRRDLRAVTRRDYFPPSEREQATAAVGNLAAACRDESVHASAVTRS